MDVGASVTEISSAPSSGAYAYQVIHDGTTWKFQVLDSGGNVDVWASIAAASICWTNKTAIWFQENWNLGDPLGGEVTNHYHSTGNKYRTSAGGSWHWTAYNSSNACQIVGANPPHKCDVVSATAYDTWTDR
jgi:hypothetical protein